MRVGFIALLACGLSWAHAETTPHFEAYLDGLVAAQFRDYQLAGMTFALIHQGEVKLLKGYGYADLATQTKVDPERHLFRPGSVSKLFTWTAVMQLVEQGKLDLNTDVGEYIPQFELPNAYDQPLTLQHIMSHTPGLEDGGSGYLFVESADDLVPLAESLAAHIPTQVRPPGTHAAYSNWATALAGLIVANVSGMAFEDYVAQHLLAPLRMQYATFEEPLNDKLAPWMATGYGTEHGALSPRGFEYIKNFGPAGALSASAGDMTHFMLAHLQQGRFEDQQILSPQTVEQMHQASFRHHQNVAAMANGFIERWRNGQRFVGHGGDTIAFHSQMVLDPTNGFGFFLSFNTPDGARARTGIVDGVIDYFYPAEATPVNRTPLEGSAERIAAISGAYRFNRRSYTKLEGIVALTQDLPVVPAGEGQISIPLPNFGGLFQEVEPYRFQQVDRQQSLVFEVDEQNRVTRALIGTLPIIVADKLPFWEQASIHQLLIGLVFISSLFTVINTTRNRQQTFEPIAQWARRTVTAVSWLNLAFILGFTLLISTMDFERAVFEFPPTGIGALLILPVLITFLSVVALGLLMPVWRSPDWRWPVRLRYSYLVILFLLWVAVLYYWRLIGWHY